MLCEGPDDVAFFKAFIAERNLPSFRIFPSSLQKGKPGGNSKFGTALKALGLPLGKKVYELFDDILIISDNDDKPEESFELVRKQIEGALGFSPQKPRSFSEKEPKIPDQNHYAALG
jgi:hypothetical protein